MVYLACAPKSNAVYKAFNAAMDDARRHGSLEVPLKIRNAPTRLMQELGYGDGYAYAHSDPDGALKQDHFPEEIGPRRYYEPTEHGYESRIRAFLAWLEERRAKARGGGGGRESGPEEKA